jgi:hypothetical protein
MSQDQTAKKGVIDGLARIATELIKTPRHKQTIRVLLRELDPENTPALVRAITQQDPELFLSLLAGVPTFTNIGIEAAREILFALSNFTPAMMGGFTSQIVEGVNAQRLGEAAALALVLSTRVARRREDSLNEELANFGQSFGKGFAQTLLSLGETNPELVRDLTQAAVDGVSTAAGAIGKQAGVPGTTAQIFVSELTVGIQKIGAENPDFIANVVRPIADAIGEAAKPTPNARGKHDEK